jgi:hypothetical protein
LAKMCNCFFYPGGFATRGTSRNSNSKHARYLEFNKNKKRDRSQSLFLFFLLQFEARSPDGIGL